MPHNNEKIITLRENILASCGGNMSCSSCVVKIEDHWVPRLTDPSDQEIMFIEIFLDQYDIMDNYLKYRLSCQIILEENLNELCISMI